MSKKTDASAEMRAAEADTELLLVQELLGAADALDLMGELQLAGRIMGLIESRFPHHLSGDRHASNQTGESGDVG